MLLKINKIWVFMAVVCLLGFTLTGCDDNFYTPKHIGVVSVELDDALKNGLTLEERETYDISLKASFTPEDATERTENYSSSNTEVATVSPYGILTAVKAGTSEITINVGGKDATFTLTVIEIVQRPFETLELAITEKEMEIGSTFNLASSVTVTPLTGTNDYLVYSSSNNSVVTINDEGLITGVGYGTATITVASAYNSALKAELPVTGFSYLEYGGRTNWTMSASHGLPTDASANNSWDAAFDGIEDTNFCLVRPGKGSGGVTVPSGDAIYFTVDMQVSQPVSYFQIEHRDRSQLFIRWQGFDQILGSNDGTNFEVIATNVVVTGANDAEPRLSPMIEIPLTTYRHIRFYAKEARCFWQGSYTSQGNTVQIKELYLGTKVYQ